MDEQNHTSLTTSTNKLNGHTVTFPEIISGTTDNPSSDLSSPFAQQMAEAVFKKVHAEIDQLLAELRKLVKEMPQDDTSQSQEIPPDQVRGVETITQSPQTIDEALVKSITDDVLAKIMAEVNPLLSELAKLKQQSNPSGNSLLARLATASQNTPQAMYDQVMKKVSELENLKKQKSYARQLRATAITCKPPSR